MILALHFFSCVSLLLNGVQVKERVYVGYNYHFGLVSWLIFPVETSGWENLTLWKTCQNSVQVYIYQGNIWHFIDASQREIRDTPDRIISYWHALKQTMALPSSKKKQSKGMCAEKEITVILWKVWILLRAQWYNPSFQYKEKAFKTYSKHQIFFKSLRYF